MADQEDANVALMLDREIDKRVALAMYRLLVPYTTYITEQELVGRIDRGDKHGVQHALASAMATALMSESSFLNHVRTKIAEQLSRNF